MHMYLCIFLFKYQNLWHLKIPARMKRRRCEVLFFNVISLWSSGFPQFLRSVNIVTFEVLVFHRLMDASYDVVQTLHLHIEHIGIIILVLLGVFPNTLTDGHGKLASNNVKILKLDQCTWLQPFTIALNIWEILAKTSMAFGRHIIIHLSNEW